MILFFGAACIDIVVSVDNYPVEDEKVARSFTLHLKRFVIHNSEFI